MVQHVHGAGVPASGPFTEATVAPELTAKADELIIALGRLAAAQERYRGASDLEGLFNTASQAVHELTGLLASTETP